MTKRAKSGHTFKGLNADIQTLAGVFLLCAGLGWFAGLLDPLAGLLGGQRLVQSNAAYIQSVQANEVKELATLGAILAVVDVVASVEVGFNFVASAEIGVGNAIQSLSLLLDQAMKALIVSSASFEVLKILLAISDAMSGALFALSMASLGLLLLLRRYMATEKITDLFEDVALIIVALFVFSYVIIPYSVQISAWSAAEITHVLHATTRDGLAALHTDIVERATEASSAKDWSKKGTAVAAFDHLSNDLPQKTEATASLVWSFWARTFTHAILIPIVVAFVLKQLMHHLFRFLGLRS